MTEKELLKTLGIKDYSQINSKNFVSFSSMFDYLDSATAEKVLDQFPNFKDAAVSVAQDYKSIFENVLSANKELATTSIDSCKIIIDCLCHEIDKSLTFEEKKYYIGEIKQLNDNVIRITQDNQNNNSVLYFLVGIALLGLTGFLGYAIGARVVPTSVIKI